MANDAQAKYWNEIAGPHWVDRERIYDRMLEPCQRAVLAALAPRLGETILDIGCGFGTTSIAVASVIGSNGRVHGVDISRAMIDRALTRLGASPLNLSFGVRDVQSDTLAGPYDAAVSRFGVMFFEDPAAAFGNIGAAMRPGGRLAFVCWQAPALNPFFGMVARHLVPLLAEPPTAQPPDAPGPFAFHDPDRVRSLLADSGWVDVAIEPFEPTLRFDIAADDDGIDAIVGLALDSEIGRTAVRDAGEEAVRTRLDLAREQLRSHLVDGTVQLRGAIWIVTARRGDDA